MTQPDDGLLHDTAFSLDFFEVVEVRRGAIDDPAGGRGTVLGRARAGDGSESYAVAFDGSTETSMISRADLEPTGERRRPEDFYDGSRIRVDVDGELL